MDKVTNIPDNLEIDFAGSLKNFADSNSALRDFVDMVGTELSEKTKGLYLQHAKALAPLGVLMSRLNPEMQDIFPFSEESNSIFDGTIAVEKTEDGFTMKLTGRGVGPFNDALASVKRTQSHKGLLYRNSLISLISSAEWLLAQLIRLYYEKYPEAIGLDDKRLSFKEISALGSLEDAKSYLTDLKIEEVMRGSFETWLDFIKKHFKLQMDYIEPLRSELIEIFQRRNLLVHNNGVVNAHYLKNVSVENGVKLGSDLVVSSHYLQKAIDTIELSFLLIGAELWKHLKKDDNNRPKQILHLAFERLSSERWQVAKGLSCFLMHDKQADEQHRMFGKCNYWQCQKWIGDFEDTKREIAEADFSANDELFQLARFTLLDDYAAVFALLPRVIDQKKLQVEALDGWPIFREVRKRPEYLEFRKTLTPGENVVETNPPAETSSGLVN